MTLGCWLNLVRSWTVFCCFCDYGSLPVSLSSRLTFWLGLGTLCWVFFVVVVFSNKPDIPSAFSLPCAIVPHWTAFPTNFASSPVIACYWSWLNACYLRKGRKFLCCSDPLSLSYTLCAFTFVMRLSHVPVLPPHDTQTVPCILNGSCLGLSRLLFPVPSTHTPVIRELQWYGLIWNLCLGLFSASVL